MIKLRRTLFQKRRIKILLLALIFMLGLLTLIGLTPSDDMKMKFGEIYELNETWTVEKPDGTVGTIDLPDNISIIPGETIRITKVLPIDFHNSKTIRIRSSMQTIQVDLDNIRIYDNSVFKSEVVPYTPEASAWILIDIPENHENSLLEIMISSEIPVMSGMLNEIYYGSRGDLIGELISRNTIGIFVVIFVFSVALFAFIASLSVNLNTIIRLNYLSLFSFAIGVWLVSEMDIMQLFFGHNYLIGAISYLILPIVIISFIMFMKEVVLQRYSKLLMGFVLLDGIFLISSVLIQLLRGVDYIRIWPLFMAILVVTALTIIGLLIYEIHMKSVLAKKYLAIIFIMIVTVLFEVILFLTGDFKNVSRFSSIGIFVFLVLLMFDTMKYLSHVVQKEAESKYLREIAYNDPLTKGLNRAAFEKDIDMMLTASEQLPFRLSMFDLNGLKQINDLHGHEVGDQVLKDFHNALIDSFGQDASCYRVGGDEFMVIQNDISEEVFKLALNDLQTILKECELSLGYVFGAAHGSDIYQFEKSFGEFKHHVDLKMYLEKKRQKESKYQII